MATDAEKRKGGGKLSRSETVTVRLDPKLRYLAELAARRQRRTVSSYIEWAIEDSLKHVSLDLSDDRTLADEAEALWDVDDSDRFARLALRHPDLLTHDEQVLWKLIRENGRMWLGKYAGYNQQWTWTISEEDLIFEALRANWTVFCGVAEGSTPPSSLPTWLKTKQDPKKPESTSPAQSTGFDDMDDDIPF